MVEVVSNSADETVDIGRRVGAQLRGGEIICLVGDLGAGKTHFVKGVAAGVGARSMEKVTSPTFVLVNEYFGRLEVYHIDAYRLERESDFVMLGFDEFCHPGAVVIVEWADRVAGVLGKTKHIDIVIKHAGQTRRTMTVANLPDYVTL